MRHLLILIGLALLTNTCKIDKSNKINDNLIGKWKLDSISIINGKYVAYSESKTLIFKNRTDFSYESWNGDVCFTCSGKYYILNNPKRGLLTLTLIPDIQISGNDSIRIGYMNMDIISLQGHRLIAVDETKWIDREGLPSKVFNEKYIYKRQK
jgi:hypothetical protein